MAYPCTMSGRGLIHTLPYKLKEITEQELFRDYVAKCVRLTAENTAKMVSGSYISVEYADLINPKPKQQLNSSDVITSMKNKLREGAGT